MQLLNVKASGTHSYNWALKGYILANTFFIIISSRNIIVKNSMSVNHHFTIVGVVEVTVL
jgi:hypothetical protein